MKRTQEVTLWLTKAERQRLAEWRDAATSEDRADRRLSKKINRALYLADGQELREGATMRARKAAAS